MSKESTIGWTQSTLNFATGCDKISPGCSRCYALERTIPRLQKMGQKKYRNGTKFTVHEDVMYEPLTWKKPRRIFVNSVSDTFHPNMPMPTLIKFFRDVVKKTPQHTYLILTKRPQLMSNFFKLFSEYLLPNVWLGVTGENQEWADTRLSILKDIPAKVRFVSVEPMLEPVSLEPHLGWLDWVIIGCESGTDRRHIDNKAIQNLIASCKGVPVPVFLKQVEINGKVETDVYFDGVWFSTSPVGVGMRMYHEYPKVRP